ncbi:MAG: efflux RND transporter periplasmic adaptor subunit [Candidatus Solibacter usitatus]|nr:efflux RND transporter periplasmic adaptor subunit [Candidatus Solibacter usitatus]
MNRTAKIILGIILLVAVAGGGWYGYSYTQKGIVTIQTGRVSRQDLAAVVTASGEIKPRNYINIGTNAIAPSRITEILVVEGQAVRKGQTLARLESVQPEAEVAAQNASVSSSEAESAASESSLLAADENIRTAQATLERTKSDLERARLFFERAKKLYDDKLIARQEYDQRATDMESLRAGVREAEARLAQAKAQRNQASSSLSASQKRITLAQANLKRAADVLQKTYAISPIDGMVTNLPVRVGETVVPGIQNSASSLIMTIADMSLITAEVKVDETDIVNVKLDQMADVTIDAMTNRTFKGRVIEIGNTAILRSTGLAASQSAISSQEAKDFKVVIAIENPPSEIRPGLSCTAKVTTATRQRALTIPIQALTVRQKKDLEKTPAATVNAASPTDPVKEKAMKEEIQGVFVVAGGQATFRKVETGITGATDIEVMNGLSEGDEIVTGSYKVIRTIRNEAKVKVESNKGPLKSDS